MLFNDHQGEPPPPPSRVENQSEAGGLAIHLCLPGNLGLGADRTDSSRAAAALPRVG